MGLMKKLTSAIVTSSLVFSLVGSAFAAYTPTAGQTSCDRMMELGVLKGKTEADKCALNDEITRAELVTIIVRAFGKEADAALLKGAAAFPDTASHWASGNIAMAKNLVEKAGSDAIGMPDGTFNPDGKLTPAQAVAFLMKFLGAKRDTTQAWPNDYLNKAVELGIITSADKDVIAPMLNDNATRGLVFYLFDNAFYSYKFADGTTFYTKYVDPQGPELTIDNEAVSTTLDAAVTVTGTVSGAKELYVGSAKVTPDASGKFSAEYKLDELKEYTITVTAKDTAGASTEKSIKVTRTTGEATAISAPASIEVVAGESVDVAAAVKDAKDQTIPGAAVAGTSDLGTYADGKFTAGEKAGAGELTLTSGALEAKVNVTVKAGALAKVEVSPASAALALGAAQKFEAKGFDKYGNEVAAPAVTWSATGGIIDQAGNFAGTAAGTATVTVTAGAISGTATATVFGTATKLAAAAVPELVANGSDSYDLQVSVVDANGNPVTTSTANITVNGGSANFSVDGANSATKAAVGGVATFTLKAATTTTVANGLLTITSSGLTGVNVSYKTVAQALTTLKLTADPALVGNDGNSTTSLAVKGYDQKGASMTIPADYSFALKTSAKSIVDFAGAETVTLSGGVYSTTMRALNDLGSATVSATAVYKAGAVSTLTVEPVTVSTGLISAPFKLSVDSISEKKAGQAQTIIVRVQDVNGNQVTNSTYTTVITPDGDDADDTFYTTNTSGVLSGQSATFSGVGKITFYHYASKAGTRTFKVTGTWSYAGGGSGSVVEATQTASVLPSDITAISISAGSTSLNANGAHSTTLTAKLKDAKGNTVTSGNYDVTFERGGLNGGAIPNFTKTTIQSVDGVATMNVTSGTKSWVYDSFVAKVTVNNTTYTATPVTIGSFIMGVPNYIATPSVDWANSDAAVDTDPGNGVSYAAAAGDAFIVEAEIKDGNNVNVTTDNGRAFTATAKDADGVVVGTYSGTVENGIASVTVSDLTEAQNYTFTFASEGLTTSAAVTVPMVANDVAGIALTSNLSTIGNDGFSTATVTVKTVDKYGNAKAVAANTDVVITNSNPSLGTVNGLSTLNTTHYITIAANDYDNTFSYVAGTGIGSVTFTGTNAKLTSGSVTINQSYVSAPYKLAVQAIDTITAGDDAVVKVDIQDANGVRVTGALSFLTHNWVKVYLDGASTPLTPGTHYTITQTLGRLTITLLDTAATDIREAGTHTVKVAVSTDNNGTPNDASDDFAAPYPMIESTGSFVVNAGSYNSIVTENNKANIVANGSDVMAVTVKVADLYGNPVSDANGTADLSIASGADFGSLLTPNTAITNGSGTFLVQSKYMAGTISVKVDFTYKDVVRTGYATVAVTTGSVSGTLSSAVKSTDTQITVTLRDTNGNPISNASAGSFTLAEKDGGGNEIATSYTISGVVPQLAAGVYNLNLVNAAVTNGNHTMVVKYGTVTLTGNPVLFKDASAPTFSLSNNATVAKNQASNVTVTVSDANGVNTASVIEFAPTNGFSWIPTYASVSGVAGDATRTITINGGWTGSRTLDLSATDMAGNSSTIRITINVDAAAPVVTVNGFVAGANSFTVSFDEAITGSGASGALAAADLAVVSNNAAVAVANVAASGVNTYTITLASALTSTSGETATVTVQDTVKDAAGNAVDETAPHATFTNP